MKPIRTLLAVVAGLLCTVLVHAAAPSKQPRKADRAAPESCVTKGADYVPGVDASGRPVKPADVPSDTQVVVSNEVYPEVRSQNPQVPATGLRVRIDGLGQAPKCPQKVNKSSINLR